MSWNDNVSKYVPYNQEDTSSKIKSNTYHRFIKRMDVNKYQKGITHKMAFSIRTPFITHPLDSPVPLHVPQDWLCAL